MTTGVMIDDLSLSLVQEIHTREDRRYVAHQVPGKEGTAFQNLGRLPALIVVVGVMVDELSLTSLEDLRKKYKDHQPMTFAADIATATEVQKVVIDDLRVSEIAGRPQQYSYVLRLLEFIPPPPPVKKQDLSLDAGSLLDGITNTLGDLPGLGDLNLNLVNPLPPLKTMVGGVTSVAEQMTSTLSPLNDLFGSA